MSGEDKGPAKPSTPTTSALNHNNNNNNNNNTKSVHQSRMLHPADSGDLYSRQLESSKWQATTSPNLHPRWEDGGGGPVFSPLVKVAI